MATLHSLHQPALLGLLLTNCLWVMPPSMFRPAALGQPSFQEFITFPLGDTLASFNFVPTPTGGFGSFFTYYGDKYLIRTDDTGLPTWAGNAHFDTPLLPPFGTLFSAMPDGGVLIKGPDLQAYGASGWVHQAFCAARIDAAGQLLWSKRYVMSDSTEFSAYGQFRLHAFPDGTSLAVSLPESFWPGYLFVLKLDQQGLPIWCTTIDIGSLSGTLPMYEVELTADGGCAVLMTAETFPSAYDVIRVDGNGDFAWARSYEMTNAPWYVIFSGMEGDASGNLVIGCQRSGGMLNYGDLLWLSPTGAPYRHRLDPDNFYSDYLSAWNDDALWIGRRAIDSTGASVLGGYSLINPGTFSNTDHYFAPSTHHLLNDDLWLHGRYVEQDNTFGYLVIRPFLMRTPSMAITGCRLDQLPTAAINYLDVPDSLLQITSLNLPWWQTTPSVADTAVVIQARNPNSVYDLCAIVGVEEHALLDVSVQLWPDPLHQGTLMNVDATQPSDLVIFDLSGRAVLEIRDQRSARRVDISRFGPGTYLATGHDGQGTRLWSRRFIVL